VRRAGVHANERDTRAVAISFVEQIDTTSTHRY
jgi:hypothetical protein